MPGFIAALTKHRFWFLNVVATVASESKHLPLRNVPDHPAPSFSAHPVTLAMLV